MLESMELWREKLTRLISTKIYNNVTIADDHKEMAKVYIRWEV